MKKIMVIGCCGSGKSTLSKKLAQKLNLPLVHLDMLNWCGNWECIPQQAFDDLLLAELQKEAWIIEGNYNRTIELRLQYCDTVIYLDYPRLTCLLGVLKRVIAYHGRTRSDMGGNCPEKFDLDFLKFVWNFNQNHREHYLKLLSEQTDKNVIILRNRKEGATFLKQMNG